MYIPEYFKNENIEAVKAFIDENGFAILISQVDGKLWATHIPLILSKDPDGKDILIGHISKANSQWKNFEKNMEILAVFSGPHAYISSSWYDHENVPTWNYLAVHVYGKIHIVEGDTQKKYLSNMVNKYESDMPCPVRMENMSKELIENLMRGIVGFEIEIAEIQAATKLSQNRDEKNYERIINGLKQQGDINSLEIARIMKKKK